MDVRWWVGWCWAVARTLARSLTRCSTLEQFQDLSLVLASLIQQKCKCPPLPAPTSISDTYTARTTEERWRGPEECARDRDRGSRVGCARSFDDGYGGRSSTTNHTRPPFSTRLAAATGENSTDSPGPSVRTSVCQKESEVSRRRSSTPSPERVSAAHSTTPPSASLTSRVVRHQGPGLLRGQVGRQDARQPNPGSE